MPRAGTEGLSAGRGPVSQERPPFSRGHVASEEESAAGASQCGLTCNRQVRGEAGEVTKEPCSPLFQLFNQYHCLLLTTFTIL